MSRSYKKMPVIKQKYGCKLIKWYRRKASKAVRRYKDEITNGSAYKKIYESWDLNDYTFYEPWNVGTKKDYDSKKEWAKYYYRK